MGPPGPSSSTRGGTNLPLPPGEGRGAGSWHRQTTPARQRTTWRDELFLLAPAVAILALVSSQTGFSTHVRYAIPALPYFFIWCGKLLADHAWICSERPLWRSVAARSGIYRLILERHRGRSVQTVFACLCITAAIIESLSVFPHSLSFFNLLIGGPRHGHEWLLDSNGAWGQDLLYLKKWLDRHPETRPLRLATVGWLDPHALGIEYTLPPVGPSRSISDDDRAEIRRGADVTLSIRERAAVGAARAARDAEHEPVPQTWQDVHSLDRLGPQPGWYVIDANFLHGTEWPATSPGWRLQKIADQGLNYEYFRLFEPCDRIGQSYLVYHITADEGLRARRALGLGVDGQ